jgi:valyl-tRNA synthetase
MLINAPYPEVVAARENKEIEARFDTLKDLISKVRATKVDCGIDPAIKINIAVKIEKGSAAEVARQKVEMIQLLGGVAKVDFVDAKPASSIGAVGAGFEVFVLVDENINKEQLLTRFQKALEKEQGYARMSQNKLNGNFAQHAPANLVQEERDRLAESQRKIATLESYIKELQ